MYQSPYWEFDGFSDIKSTDDVLLHFIMWRYGIGRNADYLIVNSTKIDRHPETIVLEPLSQNEMKRS